MTERQINLLRKARRKLAASKALLAQGFAEDAVSRTYYTMFYLAEAFLDVSESSEGSSQSLAGCRLSFTAT